MEKGHSIQLEVNDYCDGCGNFEPHVEKLFSHGFGMPYMVTTITCENKDRCKILMKHLEKKIKEEK